MTHREEKNKKTGSRVGSDYDESRKNKKDIKIMNYKILLCAQYSMSTKYDVTFSLYCGNIISLLFSQVKNVIKRTESYALEVCDKLFVCQLSKTHYSSLGKEKNAAIKNTCTKIQMTESSTV
jgi:hypothetical protein